MQVTDFQKHVTAMKAHYTGVAFARYSLPVEVVNDFQLPYLLRGSQSFDEDLDKVNKYNEKVLRNNVDENQSALEKEAGKLASSRDDDAIKEFREQLNKRKAKMKAASDKLLDESFDRFLKVGIEHPESQSTILNSADAFCSFTTFIFDGITKFVGDIVEKALNIVNTVVETVSDFCGSVKDSITNFFGVFNLSKSLQMNPAYNHGLLKSHGGVNNDLNSAINAVGKYLESETKNENEIQIKYAKEDEDDIREIIRKINGNRGRLTAPDSFPSPLQDALSYTGPVAIICFTICYLVFSSYTVTIATENTALIFTPPKKDRS
ncbi:MAG: hypothetical protein AAF572_28095 [Cyanobacteria bacterium P01_B01_bin.77]